MNVLMIGGYSYLGMAIGKCLSKKGHRISVLDTTDDYKYADFIHKFYEFGKKDQIKKLVSGKRFNLVLYIDSACCRHMQQSDSMYVLKEFLSYASRQKDCRFLFLSFLKSTTLDTIEDGEVYFEHNDNLDTIKTMLYQNICTEYRDKYNMKVSILRVSCPYGPGCVINILYDLMNRPWRVSLYQNPTIMNNYFDYIYIGDVVSAVYKTIMKDENVVLNICTGISYNISDIMDILSRMNYNRTVNLEKYAISRGRKVYSNKKAEKCLGWTPETNIVKGLKSLVDNSDIDGSEEIPIFKLLTKLHNKFKEIFKNVFKPSPLGINLSLFILFFLCTYFFEKNNTYVRIDYRFLYIAVMSMAYGFKQGIISAGLSTLSLVIYPDIFRYNYFDVIGRCSIFFVTAVLLSYIRNYQLLKMIKLKSENSSMKKDLFKLSKKYEEIRSESFEHQNKAFIGEERFSDLYTTIRLLNTLNSDEIINGAVEVVEKSLLTNNVVIFKVNKSRTYLRAIVICGNSKEKWKRKSFRINDYKAMRAVVFERRTYINKSIVSDIPTIMSPIIDKNKVLYVLGVYDLEFEDFDINSKNRVSMIANIISCYMHSSIKYENARRDEIYIQGTEILKFDYFRKKIQMKYYMRSKENVPYSILKLDCENIGVRGIYNSAREVVRCTDTFGMDYKKNLFILLENTDDNEANTVIKRLGMAGIEARRVKGDHLVSLNEEYLDMNSLREATISIIPQDGEE